jgi:phosphatidylinositol alpha-mannosyltransferase
MRVGLVCPYSFDVSGGVQNHVLGLAHYLRSAGHQPQLLAPGTPERDTGIGFTSAGAAVPVPYNGSVARVNFGPLSAARARRWLRRGRFDLVHIHEPISPSIGLLSLWATDSPVVATFHSAMPRSRSMQVAGGALRASVERIDAAIAVSESARRVVIQHLGRDAVVVPNGFDYAAFAPRSPASAGVSPISRSAGPWRGGAVPRISFLGRVDEPRKGLPVLLEALPAIRAALGEVDVVIAGQGQPPRRVPARVLGPVSDPEKAALLGSSDVFVAPHLERESFGIVLLEAMASGAYVVASALPAFADVLAPDAEVGSDPCGTLFPPGDSSALAAAVVDAVRRPEPRRIWRARQYARRYDWSRVGPEVLDVYAAVTDARGTRVVP